MTNTEKRLCWVYINGIDGAFAFDVKSAAHAKDIALKLAQAVKNRNRDEPKLIFLQHDDVESEVDGCCFLDIDIKAWVIGQPKRDEMEEIQLQIARQHLKAHQEGEDWR